MKDKKTGGWFNGQEFIFLLLVTNTVTIPVGFHFYTPDPDLKEWKKLNKTERNAKIAAKDRTKRPEPNPSFLSKQALALEMLEAFAKNHPEIKIKDVLADALYGNACFMNKAIKVTACKGIEGA